MQVVGRTHSEVGEEFEVAHTIRAELEVATREAVFRAAPEGTEVDGLDAAGKADVGIRFGGFGEFGRFRGFESCGGFGGWETGGGMVRWSLIGVWGIG